MAVASKIAFNNWADTATLSANRTMASGFPLAHAQSSLRGRIARTASSHTSLLLSATLSAAQSIGCVAVFGLPANAAVTYALAGKLSGATVVSRSISYSGGVASGHPAQGLATNTAIFWFDPISLNYVEVVMSVAAAQVWEVSRLFVGEVVSPARGVAPDAEMALVDASVLQRMDSGSLRVDVGAQWPRASFGFAKLREDERAALFQAFRKVGRTGEVVVSLWQGEGGTRERDHQFMGRISSDLPASLQTWERFGCKLEVVGS